MAYFNHDHREREHVGFLAVYPFVQDLWRGPSRSVAVQGQGRGAPGGIQVSSDRGEAEIGDACVTGVIHKDVWLARCQWGDETRFKITTYSLEIPMDHIARVEVAEALSDIG